MTETAQPAEYKVLAILWTFTPGIYLEWRILKVKDKLAKYMRFRHNTVYLGYRPIPQVDFSPGLTPGKSHTWVPTFSQHLQKLKEILPWSWGGFRDLAKMLYDYETLK
jgi:hypothetical protein